MSIALTLSFAIAAMFALAAMNERVARSWRSCPACGGRERHHKTCPYREQS